MSKVSDETSIDNIDIMAQTWNCLNNAGIRTVGEIRGMSDAELLRVPFLPAGKLPEIRAQAPFVGECRPTVDQLTAVGVAYRAFTAALTKQPRG
jgi:hypothetical protein